MDEERRIMQVGVDSTERLCYDASHQVSVVLEHISEVTDTRSGLNPGQEMKQSESKTISVMQSRF